MRPWGNDKPNKVGAASELQIAPIRQDGTLRNRVTIWGVRVGNDLFVRYYAGPGGAWFRASLVTHKGHFTVSGVDKDVICVEESDTKNNEGISAAYIAKYSHYPEYGTPMIIPKVRATTLKLTPHETSS